MVFEILRMEVLSDKGLPTIQTAVIRNSRLFRRTFIPRGRKNL